MHLQLHRSTVVWQYRSSLSVSLLSPTCSITDITVMAPKSKSNAAKPTSPRRESLTKDKNNDGR